MHVQHSCSKLCFLRLLLRNVEGAKEPLQETAFSCREMDVIYPSLFL